MPARAFSIAFSLMSVPKSWIGTSEAFSCARNSSSAMTSEYASSPVEHPADQMRMAPPSRFCLQDLGEDVLLRACSNASPSRKNDVTWMRMSSKSAVASARIFARAAHVLVERRQLAQRHPASQPPPDARELVFAEVDADRRCAARTKTFFELAVVRRVGERAASRCAQEWVLADPQQLVGELGDGQDEVDDARPDRGLGHAAELRRRGVLRERDARLRLDRAQPLGAVGRRPRQDDADRLTAASAARALKKKSMGRCGRRASLGRGSERERSVEDADVGVRAG